MFGFVESPVVSLCHGFFSDYGVKMSAFLSVGAPNIDQWEFISPSRALREDRENNEPLPPSSLLTFTDIVKTKECVFL